jgi:hypothetical protein
VGAKKSFLAFTGVVIASILIEFNKTSTLTEELLDEFVYEYELVEVEQMEATLL